MMRYSTRKVVFFSSSCRDGLDLRVTLPPLCLPLYDENVNEHLQ